MPVFIEEDLSYSYHNFYGIFIGIEQFIDSKGGIRSLLTANNDAYKLSEFFMKNCNLENKKAEIALFTDRKYMKRKKDIQAHIPIEEGTRSKILGKLTEYLNSSKPNDLLLLYISTHGEIDYNDYFFIPSDGDIKNILGTGISSTTLVQSLSKASGKGVNVLMIVDTCYSGAIGFDIAKYKGVFSCFLSSSPVESSYESFNFKHSIFTYYLIKGLEGKAIKQGKITLVSLYDYVYENVQRVTYKKQNPLLIGTMRFDFSFIKPTEISTQR